MASENNALDQLKDLLDKHQANSSAWAEKLPTMRARSSATSIFLRGLASSDPLHRPCRLPYADVFVAAPDKEWANGVLETLITLLPAEPQVEVVTPFRLPEPIGARCYTARYHITLPHTPGAKTTEKVLSALTTIPYAEAEYSPTLNFVVVAPAE